MNKLYLIKNPELFQGEKYLKSNKNYFEGWYFKNIDDKNGISFIPGISMDKNNKKAFIQVITNNFSYFINYDINDFVFNEKTFYIKIKNSIFSKDGIHIDIKDDKQNVRIYGDIKYINSKNINTNIFNPNIMGPFSYIPFMECNHAILSMKNTAIGELKINDKFIKFSKGIGYIEKDWGISFPKSYIWFQGNNFKKKNASFMLAIADIPFKIFRFKGFICDILIDNKEFKFSTYNNAKIINNIITDNISSISLKKDNYYLDIRSIYNKGYKLTAPIRGKMERDVFESISAQITITLKVKEKTIFSDTSNNCGMEMVNM